MSEKVYVLNVYNTMTGQYELIQVTKEVFQTYRRTKWNIEDSTERFFKHETQMSSLIGGENDGYERFHEFIDYDNTPENQAIEEMVFQSLHNVLELLPPKDYELIYELWLFDGYAGQISDKGKARAALTVCSPAARANKHRGRAHQRRRAAGAVEKFHALAPLPVRSLIASASSRS